MDWQRQIGGRRLGLPHLQHQIMWLWLWTIWFQTMSLLCYLSGDSLPTSVENEGGFFARKLDRQCADLGRLLNSETKVSELLYGHTEFGKLVSAMDLSWGTQLVYWWENMTVFVPDPASQEWKDLRLTEEFETRGCNRTNSRRQCPRIRRFLEHHLLDTSFLQEGKKRKTKAGNKIWWGQVGEYGYIYPKGIRILKREAALNGEVIVIERPLSS